MGFLTRLLRDLFKASRPRIEIRDKLHLEEVPLRPWSVSEPPPINVATVVPPPRLVAEPSILRGHCWVLDGDTIVIEKVHVRLSGIDAPELDHPLGQKAKWALHALCKGQIVTATLDGSVSHERAVGTCLLPDGRDLAAEMVKSGLALDWPKYSGGRYRHLETPEARKKLWRANARQRGRMIPAKGKD